MWALQLRREDGADRWDPACNGQERGWAPTSRAWGTWGAGPLVLYFVFFFIYLFIFLIYFSYL
jgi:hypothetical protein